GGRGRLSERAAALGTWTARFLVRGARASAVGSAPGLHRPVVAGAARTMVGVCGTALVRRRPVLVVPRSGWLAGARADPADASRAGCLRPRRGRVARRAACAPGAPRACGALRGRTRSLGRGLAAAD